MGHIIRYCPNATLKWVPVSKTKKVPTQESPPLVASNVSAKGKSLESDNHGIIPSSKDTSTPSSSDQALPSGINCAVSESVPKDND